MPRYQVTINEREYDIRLEYRSERFIASVNGAVRDVVVRPLGETRSLLLIDGVSLEVDVHPGSNGYRAVVVGGVEMQAQVEDYNVALARKAAGATVHSVRESSMKAPMPGLVVDIRVTSGDHVKKGQPLVVIEAMKMENLLRARQDATIKAVVVTNGQSVEKGDTLVEFA